MQVKNVAADMIRDMNHLTDGKHFIINPEDARKIKMVATMVNHATKFLLPFGGKLLEHNNFGNEYWHVTDEDRKLLHLPFDTCLFVFPAEYAEDSDQAKAKNFEVDYTGVLCMHDNREEIGGIVGVPLVRTRDAEVGSLWLPSPIGFVVSRKNRDELLSENPDYADTLPNQQDAVYVKYVPFFKKIDERDLTELVRLHNTRMFADAILDVLRIMQCSNITSEVIEGTGATKQVNDKRIAKGKMPFYEYHQFIVDVSGSNKDISQHYNGSGGKRR